MINNYKLNIDISVNLMIFLYFNNKIIKQIFK